MFLPHPETIVVVWLLAELLGTQDVKLAHLTRQCLGVGEPFGEEHDLGNESIVRDHHCHWAKTHLSGEATPENALN